jgi:hypothetical protein
MAETSATHYKNKTHFIPEHDTFEEGNVDVEYNRAMYSADGSNLLLALPTEIHDVTSCILYEFSIIMENV